MFKGERIMNSTEELIKIAAKEAIKEFNKEQEEKKFVYSAARRTAKSITKIQIN